jgi:outer membrane protein assembly factor BamB
MKLRSFPGFPLLLLTIPLFASGADWTRFRGPDGLATSQDTGLPVRWSAKENVAWRTELPGPGTSSPITLGDRIFLTCYSGYALDASDPGDVNKLQRHVLCLDRTNGAIRWQKEFQPTVEESKYSGGNNTWHGYSSSTPATDGQRLYVFFGGSGVYCLDLAGNQLWHADVGSKTAGWGSGNSPLLYKGLLIVNASIESNSLRALDKMTGKEVWRVDDISGSRNTPILVDVPGGATELVLSLPGDPGAIVGYDPNSGEKLWSCKGIPDKGYVCPSVVAHNGVVYAIGGRKNTALAVKAGGRGEVSNSHLLWEVGKGSNVSSPAYHDGYLYWIHEKQGVAYCLDAATGKVMYETRLEPRPGVTYSSVTIADGKIYAVSQHDGAYVLAAKPEFELLAHNEFADDESRANACVVVSSGQLLLRNDRYIYCLGKK